MMKFNQLTRALCFLVAVLAVVAYHVVIPHLSGGLVGVDISTLFQDF